MSTLLYLRLFNESHQLQLLDLCISDVITLQYYSTQSSQIIKLHKNQAEHIRCVFPKEVIVSNSYPFALIPKLTAEGHLSSNRAQMLIAGNLQVKECDAAQYLDEFNVKEKISYLN